MVQGVQPGAHSSLASLHSTVSWLSLTVRTGLLCTLANKLASNLHTSVKNSNTGLQTKINSKETCWQIAMDMIGTSFWGEHTFWSLTCLPNYYYYYYYYHYYTIRCVTLGVVAPLSMSKSERLSCYSWIRVPSSSWYFAHNVVMLITGL